MVKNPNSLVYPYFRTITPNFDPRSQTSNSDFAKRADIVLLHGFTQNSDTVEGFALLLAELTTRTVHVLDLPGHGKSSMIKLSLSECATTIHSMFNNSIYVGYSLGGRIAMHLAQLAPESVTALVIIAAHPGPSTSLERQARLNTDLKLSRRLEQITTDDQLTEFLQTWIKQDVFQNLNQDEANLRARLQNDPGGLAWASQYLSLATQADLQSVLSSSLIPLLYIYGSDDLKYAEVGDRMVKLNAKFSKVAIPNSGHYVLGQKPYVAASIIEKYIEHIN